MGLLPVGLACAVTAASLLTQVAGAPAVEFEVASVRPNKTGSRNSSISTAPGGPVTATNVTVRTLILSAYRLQRLRLVGGLDWIDTDRFDVVAKRPDTATSDQLPSMWRALLEERFKLRVHQEEREQPVYRLERARRDGRLGPQLARSTADCMAIDAVRRAARGAPPQVPGQPAPCNLRASLTGGRGVISIQDRGISELASALINMVDRVVVDRTGLTGAFDIELRWTADTGAAPNAGADEPPSIFTALQEQLGLRLQPAREPVEVLVIDAVERPVAD